MTPSLSLLLLSLFILEAERDPARLKAWLRGEFYDEPAAEMVTVRGGRFRPFYPPSAEEKEVGVSSFRIDRFPVTNAEFLRFVTDEPRWRRARISALFADSEYLSHWSSADELGPQAGDREPVTRVSWFAAKAYCEWRGARLPSEMEWEYVAAADEVTADARKQPEYTKRILRWYSERTPQPRAVGQSEPNFWGVSDLHGLVWEWVLDFNSNLVSADSRDKLSADKQRFCGSGALSASDVSDYASFMRIAFRSSLEARYTTKNLGFRCATGAGDGS